MVFKSALAVLATVFTLLSSAHGLGERDDNVTVYNPPKLKPLLHLDVVVGFPTNATTLSGITAGVPNLRGNFTGVIEGEILPLGAAFESLYSTRGEEISFYTNTYSLNTTSGTIILMDATATIHYVNNALHGFGHVSFQTGEQEYIQLNYGSYVAEFEAIFNTGEAFVDVFELESAGRRDGLEVPALLPPGEASPPE